MERTCSFCKKYFESYPGDKQRYCSEECHQKYLERQRLHHILKLDVYDNCVFCGKKIEGKRRGTKYCSDLCRRKHRDIKNGTIEDHGELTKTCPVCGEKFRTWKSTKKTCSELCSNRLHSQRADRRLRGKIVDRDITLKKLSMRDNNQCQICGLLVDWSDFTVKSNGRKSYGNMYPSKDHILPVSMGGVHSWDNIQLAHRICNSRKGNNNGLLRHSILAKQAEYEEIEGFSSVSVL